MQAQTALWVVALLVLLAALTKLANVDKIMAVFTAFTPGIDSSGGSGPAASNFARDPTCTRYSLPAVFPEATMIGPSTRRFAVALLFGVLASPDPLGNFFRPLGRQVRPSWIPVDRAETGRRKPGDSVLLRSS